MGRYDAETSVSGSAGQISGSASKDSQAFDVGEGAAKGDTGSSLGSGEYQDKTVSDPAVPQAAQGPLSTSKYGDPNAPQSQQGMMALQHLAAGKVDNRFYGHTLPQHFKKTSIIGTTGRVR